MFKFIKRWIWIIPPFTFFIPEIMLPNGKDFIIGVSFWMWCLASMVIGLAYKTGCINWAIIDLFLIMLFFSFVMSIMYYFMDKFENERQIENVRESKDLSD